MKLLPHIPNPLDLFRRKAPAKVTPSDAELVDSGERWSPPVDEDAHHAAVLKAVGQHPDQIAARASAPVVEPDPVETFYPDAKTTVIPHLSPTFPVASVAAPETDTVAPATQEITMVTATPTPNVSEIAKVEKSVVSFFCKVKSEIGHLFSKTPSFAQTASATLTYVAPLVEALVTLADPAAAAAASEIVAKVESALAAAAVVVKDAGPTPTLLTYLQAINADIAQIEAAAQIKDATTAAKLTAITGTITGEISAIISEVESAKAA